MVTKAYSYIRMSTAEQKKGDSLRRQLEATEKFVKQQGWELDDTLKDLGVSAYRGKNRTEGELKKFLEKVDNNEVPEGSFLIVESLDRLSRDRIFKALNLFTSIIEKGIGIVTLSDGMIYTEKKVNDNWTQLIVSLAIMSRAHEESRMKGIRVSAAWDKKRDNAASKKITSRCPGWLKLNKKTGQFEVIEERANIVKRIFELSAGGLGRRSITRTFNQEGVETFGKASHWQDSYVSKLLDNENVLGVFQPLKQKIDADGKKLRIPYGEPIDDYYPQIISYDLFSKAKAASSSRKKSGGKKGKSFSNLLQHLTFCGACGTQMTFQDKGKGSKGGQYLVCDSYKRGTGCSENTHHRYKDLLFFILTKNRVFRNEDMARFGITHKRELEEKLSELKIKLDQTTRVHERWVEKFETEEDKELSLDAGRRADEKLKEIGLFRLHIEEVSTKIEQIDTQQSTVKEFFKESYFRNVCMRLDKCKSSEELYVERAKINKELKDVYELVRIGGGEVEFLKMKPREGSEEILSRTEYKKRVDIEKSQLTYYLMFPEDIPEGFDEMALDGIRNFEF